MSKYLKMTVFPYFTEEMIYKAFMQYHERPISIHLVGVKIDKDVYLIEFRHKNEAERIYKTLNKKVIKGILPAHFFTFEADVKNSAIIPKGLYPENINVSICGTNNKTFEIGDDETINTLITDDLDDNLSKSTNKISIIQQKDSNNPTRNSSLSIGDHTHQIFVHVGCSVTQIELYSVFADIFESTFSARVICDKYRRSKGYGFVDFIDKNDQQKALQLKDGQLRIRGTSINVRNAYTRAGRQRNYRDNTVNVGVLKINNSAVHEKDLPYFSNLENINKNKSLNTLSNSSVRTGIGKEQTTSSSDISSKPKLTSVLFFKGFTKGSEQTNSLGSGNDNTNTSYSIQSQQNSELKRDLVTSKTPSINAEGTIEVVNSNKLTTTEHINDENIYSEQFIKSESNKVRTGICMHSDNSSVHGQEQDLNVVETTFNKINELFEDLAIVNHSPNYQHYNSVDPVEVKKKVLVNETEKKTEVTVPSTVPTYRIEPGNQVESRNGLAVVHSIFLFLLGVFLMTAVITIKLINN